MDRTENKPQIENGFFRGQSNEAYHAGPGISKSRMSYLLRSAAHYKHTPMDDTKPAFTFGNAFHTATLEPEKFEAEYVVLPANCQKGSGKGMQERKAIFEAQAWKKGQTIIKPDEYDLVRAMSDAVWKHPQAAELLTEQGETELSAYYHDTGFDVLTKAKYDRLNKERNAIIDLKSCVDARPWAFQRDASTYHYDLQHGHYCYTASMVTGVEHTDFYFICVEKTPYHGVMVYRGSEAFYLNGLLKREQALTLYKDCLDSGNWPGYSTDIELLDPPKYAQIYKDVFYD